MLEHGNKKCNLENLGLADPPPAGPAYLTPLPTGWLLWRLIKSICVSVIKVIKYIQNPKEVTCSVNSKQDEAWGSFHQVHDKSSFHQVQRTWHVGQAKAGVINGKGMRAISRGIYRARCKNPGRRLFNCLIYTLSHTHTPCPLLLWKLQPSGQLGIWIVETRLSKAFKIWISFVSK